MEESADEDEKEPVCVQVPIPEVNSNQDSKDLVLTRRASNLGILVILVLLGGG